MTEGNRNILPPDHPDAPKYWIYESSGELATAVKTYLAGERLTNHQIRLMRAYLWQWVRSPVWGASGSLEALRLRVAFIDSREELSQAITHAEALGMDPL